MPTQEQAHQSHAGGLSTAAYEDVQQQAQAAHHNSDTCTPPLDRVELLSKSLKHVGTMGWSQDSLVAAAREMGLSPAVIGILGAGEGDLVNHFVKQCNAQLQADLQANKDELQGKGTTHTIKYSVQRRLQMLGPYINTWPQALSIAAQPSNLAAYLQLQYELVDMIWHAAGDKSVDSSWYTKRLLLSGVYTSTELYMLTDFSPDFSDTWGALDRRLADVVSTAKLTKEVGQMLSSQLASVVPSLRDMAAGKQPQ